MTPHKCLLCHSEQTHIVQTIAKEDICALYAQKFGVKIEHIISSDLNYHHCQECDLRFFVCEDGSIPTGDNDFYNALNQIDWYYFAEKNEYHYVKQFVKPESKVLEVGCGKAAFVKFMPEEARKNYVGLEFSTEAKKMAARDGILIENQSVEDYAKSHAKSFDIACSFQVLEHVSDVKGFLQAQIDCLKDTHAAVKNNTAPSDFTTQNITLQARPDSQLMGGGQYEILREYPSPLLIIATPSEESFIQYYVNGLLNMPPHHISRFSDKTLHKIAEIFDLELLSLYHEPIQPEHFQSYKNAMWAKLFLPTPLVDRSLKRQIIRIIGFGARQFIKVPKDAYGHTVVAVYTLKNR